MKFRALILSNLFRKKVRLILTLGSFAVALFLFAFLAVVRDAFNRGGSVASANRLVTINRVSIIQPLPLSYRDKIARIPGRAERDSRQLVRRRLSGREELLPPVRHRSRKPSARCLPELLVSDDQWNAFLKDRQGAIAGASTRQALWLEDRRPHPHQDDDLWQRELLGVQSRRHLSWQDVRRTTRRSSGSSGTISRSASPSRSRAKWDGIPSSSTRPMTPSA